jgi:hypothetical protein
LIVVPDLEFSVKQRQFLGLKMVSSCTPFFLSLFLLSQTAAAYTLAQDAIPANPNGRISAKYALLFLRQNTVYCTG